MHTNHKDQKIQPTVKNITHLGQVKIGGKKCIFSDLQNRLEELCKNRFHPLGGAPCPRQLPETDVCTSITDIKKSNLTDVETHRRILGSKIITILSGVPR